MGGENAGELKCARDKMSIGGIQDRARRVLPSKALAPIRRETLSSSVRTRLDPKSGARSTGGADLAGLEL